MIEQLDPGEAPPADGGAGGTTVLVKSPLTFSYVSPEFLCAVVAVAHVQREENESRQPSDRVATHYLQRKDGEI